MSKRYKIIKSDLCIAGKIYKEGTEVNFKDDKLEQYFELVPEAVSKKIDEVLPAPLEAVPVPIPVSLPLPLPLPETINQSSKKAKIKKAPEDPVVEQQI